jgi:uncharacterized integral membrane protein
MRWVHLAILAVFVAVIVIAAVQNLHVVEFSFLGARIHMRLAFLIAGVYVLGAATGGGLLALLRHSYKGARISR